MEKSQHPLAVSLNPWCPRGVTWQAGWVSAQAVSGLAVKAYLQRWESSLCSPPCLVPIAEAHSAEQQRSCVPWHCNRRLPHLLQSPHGCWHALHLGLAYCQGITADTSLPSPTPQRRPDLSLRVLGFIRFGAEQMGSAVLQSR